MATRANTATTVPIRVLHPMSVALVVGAVTVLASAVAPWPLLLWCLGGFAAGYSLSGST
jgi:hypothetical protein